GPLPRDPLQQPYGLEEVEGVRLAEQPLAQISTRSPVLGGHRRSSPSPPVRAVSLVKEFIVQYKARNRSSTLANRNSSLPETRPSRPAEEGPAGPAAAGAPPTRDAGDAGDQGPGLRRVGEVVEFEDLAQGVGLLVVVHQGEVVERQVGDQTPQGPLPLRRPQGA